MSATICFVVYATIHFVAYGTIAVCIANVLLVYLIMLTNHGVLSHNAAKNNGLEGLVCPQPRRDKKTA